MTASDKFAIARAETMKIAFGIPSYTIKRRQFVQKNVMRVSASNKFTCNQNELKKDLE